MPLVNKQRFFKESVAALAILHRDTRRRVALMTTIVMLFAYVDMGDAAARLAALALGFEVLCKVVWRMRRNTRGRWHAATPWATWALCLLHVVPFIYPATQMIGHGTPGLLIVGLVWIFSALLHVGLMFAHLRIYSGSLTPVLLASITLVLLRATESHEFVALGDDLAIVFAMLFIYFAVVVEAMRRHMASFNELETARDFAQRRLGELEHLTQHDPLTELMNRRAFTTALQTALARFDTHGPVSVFLIDLDGFKPINDNYSHAAGDALLRAIGARLRRRLRGRAVVARLGGDEFAILAQPLHEPTRAIQIARMIVAAISEPVEVDQWYLTVGASVGVAVSRGDDTVETLMSQADQAMYLAKLDESDKVRLYDPVTCPQRPSLNDQADIVAAMASGRLRPFYQPKVDLATGRIIGAEALARWQHDDGQILYPGQFLPTIRDLGLQGEFLMHMMETTLRDIGALTARGISPGYISVNLPEVTLATLSGRDALLTLVRKYPMALPHLTFEVTEDIFIARSNAIIQQSIVQFRRMGVRISLDDFGTGFASFKHLRELEFDELKLDTDFVSGLGKDTAAKVLVGGFLDIGTGLNVDVIAEGVETEEQAALLRELGCREAQGFLFSPACPLSDLIAFYESGQPVAPVRRQAAATDTNTRSDAA